MIIAMVAVRVMQMTVNEIVDVIPVRNRFVSTAGSMNVVWIVPAAGMSRSAGFGVRVTDWHRVLFDFSALALVMKVAIVKIIDVPIVLDGRVAAASSMLMIVVLVNVRHN